MSSQEKQMMTAFAKATSNAYLIKMANVFEDMSEKAPTMLRVTDPAQWESFIRGYKTIVVALGKMITMVAGGGKAAKKLVDRISELKDCLAMKRKQILPEYLQHCIKEVSKGYDYAILEAFNHKLELQEKVTLKAAGMNTLLDEHTLDTIGESAKKEKGGKGSNPFTS